jgi:hypothetical protein
MAKKSERKRLTIKLDGLCREITRLVCNDRCERCRKVIHGSNSHPCHIVPKGRGASWRRFDLINIFLGCMYCHRWWHDNPTESAKWFIDKFPVRDEYLEKYRYGKACPIKTAEMRELVESYKEKLKDLQEK